MNRPASLATGGSRPRLIALEREHDLRRRLAARDERALSELIDLLSPWLLGIAQSMLQDQDEAEEVVLDAFRIAWDKVQAPTPESRGLVAWMLQITRNRTIDRLRGRRRRARLIESVEPEVETATQAREPNEAAQPGWHVHQSVHRALAELPPAQLRVVQLAYFEGRTHSEVARSLGIPIGTVKTRLRLGVARLRVSLSPLKDWVV